MTNNEKAATFIGWMPGPCSAEIEGDNKCNGSSSDPRYWIPKPDDEGGFSISGIMWTIKHVPHEAIAPDMSDPRNYMRALISVAKDCFVEITPNGKEDGRIWVTVYRGNKLKIEADQPVKTLAALYDADHGNG